MRKAIIILAVIIVIIGSGFYIWKNVNIGFNKQELLLSRFNGFSSMISVNLCKEAYDEFITSNSKQIKGDNFFAHCKYRNEDWSNINIEAIAFSGNRRADIKYSYNLQLTDFDSKKFGDCLDFNTPNDILPSSSTFDFCESTAPTKIEKRDSIETWLYENNKWKRDY